MSLNKRIINTGGAGGTEIFFLAVAGGGGGGGNGCGGPAGGGGAGGYISSWAGAGSEKSGAGSTPVDPISASSGTVLTITIGSGNFATNSTIALYGIK